MSVPVTSLPPLMVIMVGIFGGRGAAAALEVLVAVSEMVSVVEAQAVTVSVGGAQEEVVSEAEGERVTVSEAA